MPTLDDYQHRALRTKKLPDLEDPVGYLLLGLSGETGTLISEVKKQIRDAPGRYRPAIGEELGDALWYLSTLADELGLKLSVLAAAPESFEAAAAAGKASGDLTRDCHELARAVGGVTGKSGAPEEQVQAELKEVLDRLLRIGVAAELDLDQVAEDNLAKAQERWPSKEKPTPLFDLKDDPDERLPRLLEVHILQKEPPGKRPYVLMRSKDGLHIGDRITDNIGDPDFYRFHDVFHMAYAAVLGWSPVLRSLLRCKRKSNGDKDETQDGARAIIVEEAVAAMVFAHAKDPHRNFYEGMKSLDFSLLKSVRALVQGYEVEACPYWEWEQAILQGFEAFRQLKKDKRGVVTLDLTNRRLTVKPWVESK